jgi:HEAT repeat protein
MSGGEGYLWEDIIRDVGSSATTRRIKGWGAIGSKSCEEVDAEKVVFAIDSTASLYWDKKSKMALLSAIDAWMQSEDFVKLSVVSIAKKQKDISKCLRSSHERQLLISWVCSLIPSLRRSKQVKACNLMMAIAAQLLTAALSDAEVQGRSKVWFVQKQYFQKVFQYLKDEGFDAIATSFLQESKEAGLLRFLSETKEVQHHTSSEIRKTLLKLFVDNVIACKAKPKEIDVAASLPLLASITEEEFNSEVMPGIQRMLKRSPEIIISTLVPILPKLTFNLKDHTLDLLGAFVGQFRSSHEIQREEATSAAVALCRNISEPALLTEVSDFLAQQIISKKLNQPTERKQAVDVLRSLDSKAVQLRSGSGFFNRSVQTLFQMYQKEVNESVKETILDAVLGSISSIDSLEAKDLSVLVGLLSGKSDLKAAALDILAAVSINEKIVSVLFGLESQLLSILKESVAKCALRHLFPSTMVVLINLLKKDISIWETMKKEGIPEKLISEASSLFSISSTTFKDQPSKNMATVCRDLLLGISDMNIDEIIPDLCSQLVLFTLHANREVENYVIDILKQINGASAELVLSLLDSLHHTLSANYSDPEFASQLVQKKASKCMIALAPLTESTCSSGVLVKLLMLSNHPFFMKESGFSYAWPIAMHYFNVTAKLDVKNVFVSSMPEILQELFGNDGLANQSKTEVQAAINSIGIISGLNCPNYIEHLMPLLSGISEFELHSNLKDSDFKIYFTPEGILAEEFGTYKGEVVQSKNIRRARGYGSGGAFADADDYDDYAPQRAQRRETKPKETKSKGKGKQAIDPREKARQEQLEKESNIRANLQVIGDNITKVLHVITAISSHSPGVVLDNLGEFAAISTPLMASQLLHGEALLTTKSLAKSLPSPLDRRANDLANSLWLILSPESKDQDITSSERVADSIKTFSHACKSGPLHAPVYWFLFPILKCVYESDMLTAMHEDVLKILMLHTTLDGDWPFGMTAEAIFSLWSLVPSYRNDLENGLANICKRFTKERDLLLISSGLFSTDVNIRLVTCVCLQKSPLWASKSIPASNRISIPFYIILHDPDERVATSAQNLWTMYSYGLPANFIDDIMSYLNHPNMNVVEATAAALGEAIEEHPDTSETVVGTLLNSCQGLGFQGRVGVGLSLKECSSVLDYATIRDIIDFLILKGLTDAEEKVRESMLNCGIAIVDHFGDNHSEELLDIFDRRMNSSASELALASDMEYDMIKQGLVVLLGALACHFDPSNSNVKLILDQLLGALDTPSEIVQRSVSERLPPLIKVLAKEKEEMQSMISKQLAYLKEAENFAKRKGAAFGLAGMVKGLGMSALKNYDVINILKSYIEDKKNQQAREGALLGFECLSERLGRLFEPYIIHILPLLILAFGDGITAVRQAAQDASHVIMGKLSTQGMRLVLPALLKGLDEVAWRSKQGSVQLLGTMAYCAPKQLGTCLPTIVPKIGEVLKDPHPRVQEAGKSALKEIGSVIRNPEISQISDQLLAALAEPGSKIKTALEALLTTRFINTIDAASLSLVIPILMYGLKERGKETKKKAAQIVGSLCQLVSESKDMNPYMDEIVVSLKKVLVDPIPEVRFAAAKALGSLVRGIGPGGMNELLPWLLETLKSDSTTVEKNGAAQALSEVLAVLGDNHLAELMPEIIHGCSQNVSIKEGYLTMFKYLPFAMETAFQPYLQDILPTIIAALSSDVEGVRDAAFNAAKAIIEVYGASSAALLLPVIEKGILDPMWRIRESSVDLLGRLIFKLSGKVQHESADGEEEGGEMQAFTDQQTKRMQELIGLDQWQQILSLLYLLRSDTAYTVRTNSLNIWKAIVTNTPRTLIQIVSPLMSLIITALSDQESDQQQTAALCLGELVRKFGERITKLIMPIMEEGLQSEDVDKKRGVCYGLSAILRNVSRQQIVACLPSLLPAVQKALCDDDESVRIASGDLMTTLFKGAGDVIQETVLPQVLEDINSDNENAVRSLEGLVVMLKVKPGILMEVLPEINTAPLSSIRARALGEIAKALPPASVHKQLKHFLKPLLATMNEGREENSESLCVESAAESLLSCIEDYGLYDFVSLLSRDFDDPQNCFGAAKMVQLFCLTTELDFQDLVDQLISSVVSVFSTAEGACLQECWNALDSVTKSIPPEEQGSHVPALKDAIISAREQERRKRHGGELLVAGLCKPPKALSAVLPIYLSGLLTGKNSEIREKAAEALGEMIEVTSLPSLKLFLAKITGPLIRILGDRYPWQVKLAILISIDSLLKKAGLFLKPFVPQLQTTFLKSLHDAASEVREMAASNLGRLAQLTLRIDQLVKDLLKTIHACATSSGVKEACILGLGAAVCNGPKAKLSPAMVTQAGSDLFDILADEEESSDIQRAAAFALGQYGSKCTSEELMSLLKSVCSEESENNMITFNSLLQHAFDSLHELNVFAKCMQSLKAQSRSKEDSIQIKAAEGCGIVLCKEAGKNEGSLASLSDLGPCLMGILGGTSDSVILLATIEAISQVAGKGFRLLSPLVTDLLLCLCNLLEQATGPTKIGVEDLIGSCLGIEEGPDKAFSHLNTLKVDPLVKQEVTISLLKKVAGRIK